MNTKQMNVWKEIVQQCKGHLFGSINVASNVRGDAILAADVLVELVTPELAVLLGRLAEWSERARGYAVGHWTAQDDQIGVDAEEAGELAARIREVLEETA